MEDITGIVRVTSFYKDDSFRGTGIVLTDSLVLTASHVVIEDSSKINVQHGDNEYTAVIDYKDNKICILKIAETDLLQCNISFSKNEVMDKDESWFAVGFLNGNNCLHVISGIGFYNGITTSSDYSLSNITHGQVKDYKGMSGSPVICRNRIVGILQMQGGGVLTNILVMTPVSLFWKYLPQSVMNDNEYIINLKKKFIDDTRRIIETNKASRKYIPEIFVEDSMVKEKVRYFAYPSFFFRKMIEDLSSVDFSYLNKFLKENGKEEIDFSCFKNCIQSYHDDLKMLASELIKFLNNILSLLEDSSNHYEKEKWYDMHALCNNTQQFLIKDAISLVRMLSYNYIILTAKAGQGKTNFVCDFTQNFLLRREFPVLYVNARSLSGNIIQWFQNKLSISGTDFTYSDKAITKSFESDGKALVLVIDGLNENQDNGFAKNLKDFLQWCENHKYIKILMTSRTELFTERFQEVFNDGLANGIYSVVELEINKRNKFFSRILEGYFKYFEINPTFISEEKISQMKNDVLLIRFFCEAYQGHSIAIPDIYKYRLFSKYLEKKKLEITNMHKLLGRDRFILCDLDDLLNKCCRYMIDHDNFFYIPIREFKKDERNLIDELIDSDVIFTDEFEKDKVPDQKSVYISFTYDEFRDFCIAMYLIELPTKKIETNWRKLFHGKKISIIYEGVSKYLFYLSRSNHVDLSLFLTSLNDYDKIYWDAIWGLEEDLLTEDDDKNCYDVLEKKCGYNRFVAKNLLNRRNEKCVHMNISILFSFLKKHMNSAAEYRSILCSLFDLDKMLWFNGQTLGALIDNDMYFSLTEKEICTYSNRNLLIFIVYFHGILEYEKKLWALVYRRDSNFVIDVLREVSNENVLMLKVNVLEISYHISEHLDEVSNENLFQLLSDLRCSVTKEFVSVYNMKLEMRHKWKK